MLRRLSAAVALLVGAWLILSLVFFAAPPAESAPPERADAVVMLSGEHGRLPKAKLLVREGVAPVLALSSVQDTPTWREARGLCAAGRYAGARVVCFRAKPYSTRGEARAVATLARARGWRSIVVVTSTFHITRAKILFRRCWDGRMAFVGSHTPWWRLPEEWASETAKLAIQGVLQRTC